MHHRAHAFLRGQGVERFDQEIGRPLFHRMEHVLLFGVGGEKDHRQSFGFFRGLQLLKHLQTAQPVEKPALA